MAQEKEKNKVKKGRSTIILTLVSLLIATIWVVLVFLPELTSIKSEEHRFTQLKNRIHSMIVFEKRYAKTRKSIAKYLNAVSNDKNLSLALIKLNSVIKQSNVSIVKFYPMQSVKKVCCGLHYSVKPVFVEVTGTYSGIVKMFNHILNMDIFCTIPSVSFRNPVLIPPKKVLLDVSFEVNIVYAKK